MGANLCDLLPIYIEIAGKRNYHLKPMLSRGHNFESFNEDGSSNFDDMKWDEVIKDFIRWRGNSTTN